MWNESFFSAPQLKRDSLGSSELNGARLNRLQVPALVLAATLAACAKDRPRSVSGTWTAHAESEIKECSGCEYSAGLDLFENKQGVVTGVIAQVGSGKYDLTSDAQYVLGARRSDSITFVLQPCDTGRVPIVTRFIGHITSRGDTLHGVLRAQWRSGTDSLYHVPLIFIRGPIHDTLMVQSFEWLARGCHAAA